MVSVIYYPLAQKGFELYVYKDGDSNRELWNWRLIGGRRPAGAVIVSDCAQFLVLLFKWALRLTILPGFKLLYTFHEVRPLCAYDRRRWTVVCAL